MQNMDDYYCGGLNNGCLAIVAHRYYHLWQRTSITSHPILLSLSSHFQHTQAGVIHGDFERGFIKAETISYEDLVACGSEAECKKQGKLRLEGKEYVVAEGDCILFRFNV